MVPVMYFLQAIPGVGAIPSLNFQFLNPLEILNQKDSYYLFTYWNICSIIRNGNPTGSKDYDFATQVFCKICRKRICSCQQNIDLMESYLPTEPERAASLMKAAYRGIQMLNLHQIFRMTYENGNPYKIDTSRIIIWSRYGYGLLLA